MDDYRNTVNSERSVANESVAQFDDEASASGTARYAPPPRDVQPMSIAALQLAHATARARAIELEIEMRRRLEEGEESLPLDGTPGPQQVKVLEHHTWDGTCGPLGGVLRENGSVPAKNQALPHSMTGGEGMDGTLVSPHSGITPREEGEVIDPAEKTVIHIENERFKPLTCEVLRSREPGRTVRVHEAFERLLLTRADGCRSSFRSIFDSGARECLSDWWAQEQFETSGAQLISWWRRPDVGKDTPLPTDWTGMSPAQLKAFISWEWQKSYRLLHDTSTVSGNSVNNLFHGITMNWTDVTSKAEVDVFWDKVKAVMRNSSELLQKMTTNKQNKSTKRKVSVFAQLYQNQMMI